MSWLHRLLDHRNQLLTQLAQVHLTTQHRAECGNCSSSIILASIEALVNDRLDATSQRLEESCDYERRDDNGHIVILLNDATQEILQEQNTADIQERQYARQYTIHQC